MLTFRSVAFATAVLLALAGATSPAVSDPAKVKVAVFPSVSALPYYVARERGYFAAENIDAEPVIMQSHPLIFQAMVSGTVDAAANTVTLEGANLNTKRAGLVYFFALNAQNAKWRGEVIVVRDGHAAKSLKDFKGTGAKFLSAPGPANREAARAVLVANGLVEGTDFTLAELPMGNHIGALKAGTFDAGYTLEPFAHIMEKDGTARVVESGVIAKYVIGKPEGFVPAAGAAISGKFIEANPEVSKRFARAWGKAIADIKKDPSVRDLLPKYMNTPPALAGTVPLVGFEMVSDLKDGDIADFQKFIDFAVNKGIVPAKVDARSMLKPM